MQKNFLILGGDTRQFFLKKELKKLNYCVNSYGLNGNKKSENLQSILEKSDYVIFPMPISKNGTHIYAPLSKKSISIKDICKATLLKEKTILISGINKKEKQIFEKIGVKNIFSYCTEDLLLKNAQLTAKAAIKIAKEKVSTPLLNKSVLICGLGRIGKSLISLLQYRCRKMTISTRKVKEFSTLRGERIEFIDTYKIDLSENYDIVFNTVPALIFNEKILNKTPKNTLFIDLASNPGGIDKCAAKKLKIKSIHALGLPGKFYPKESAKLIKNSLIKIIEENETS